jgi:hypothetical protein
MIEGSGSRAGSGSGSILLTSESGSGSRRPKNVWIRWIRIRIRIRNTAEKTKKLLYIVICSIKDPDCLSQIRIFSHPGSQTKKRRGKNKFVVPLRFNLISLTGRWQ